ncbi:MAG: NAD-dependent epimerase/dehydratase family protein [Elusimicrobia bacterium]|nr:NAD-dependent epimerase/dehydratase family protein [Elusimicrobiota bacterium]
MKDAAFLTGATGFVGGNLARLLVKKGLRVRALVRPDADVRNITGLDVEIIQGDLLDTKALRAGVAGARLVFHLAADYRLWVRNPDDMYAANVQGTVNVLSAAGEAGAERIVHCSSVAAVRPPKGRSPVGEESHYAGPHEPIGPYKKSKFLAEKAALELAAKGLPVVVVNPSTPVGPFDVKPTPTGKVIVDFLCGRMPSYVETGLNLVDVRDVAEGHWLAALKGRPGERYILGAENMTLGDILSVVSELSGLPKPAFKTPYALAYLVGVLDTARCRAFGGDPFAPLDAVKMARHYMWYDSSKARTELGFSPGPARLALADAVEWFRANGYAPEGTCPGPRPGPSSARPPSEASGTQLLCAATRWEAGPLAARLGLTAQPDHRLFEGVVGARPMLLLKTGMGARKTSEAMAGFERAAGGRLASISRVLSVGLAGALRPDIKPGDLVADFTAEPGVGLAARQAASGRGLRLHLGRIGAGSGVLTPAQKVSAGEATDECAVDMESGAVRRWAALHGRPFLNVRVILDAMDEPLPAFIDDPDDLAALALQALLHPFSVPYLLRLGARADRCVGNLAAFLEEFLPRL